MNLIEFISFIAAMLFMVLSMRRKNEGPQNRDEEEEEEEQMRKLRDFLQGVNSDMQDGYYSEKKAQAPVAPKPQQQKPQLQQQPKPAYTPSLQPKKALKPKAAKSYEPMQPVEHSNVFNDEIQNDTYSLVKTHKRSRGYNLIHRLKDPKEMFILQEIIGPPKGLKGEGAHDSFSL